MYHVALCIDGTEYKLAVNLTGKGAPTSATEANVGMFYMDENNGNVYKRTVSGWEFFTSGGEIVQTTGDSKTAVMSQYAVTTAIENEKEVYNITSADTIYSSADDLPLNVGNGTCYVVANSDVKALYAFDATESKWNRKSDLKPHTIYAVLTGDKAGLYRYTMSAPYLVSVESHTLQEAKDYADSLLGNIYDLVITSDEEFSKCLYALYGGSANTEFEHTNVLVKDVVFKIQRGSSDIYLHIFQPSIKYIKFENCRWETEWCVSGKAPTTLASGGAQYERAPGNFDLVIDGIEVSADNVQAAKDAGVYWYIGLRNIKALINSTVRYPDGYDLANGWDFKLTCQYFDYASNNRVPALWDGANVSDCYITEKLVRCKGCVNIASAPVLKDGVTNPVAVQNCMCLSNFIGTFSYSSCTSVDYDTCEGIEEPSTQQKPYDYIVRNMTELRDVLTKSLAGRRILLRDFDINTTDTLDFKWAGYVEFSNMRFYADIILANVWALDGAGLDAGNNKYSVTVEGNGRSRVSNFGRLPVSSTESKYIFNKCRLVTGCIIGEANECSAIHGCYISKNADVVISGCTDICGLTVVPSGRTANITLSGCKNISHISNKGSGSIIYTNCTNVDYLTCDGAEVDEGTDSPTIDTSNLANAVKGIVSGQTLSIDDISPLTSKLRVNVAGKQTDEGAVATVAETGSELVNLVPYPYADGMRKDNVNGITFVVNADGSITVSGKATGVASFTIINVPNSIAPFEKGQFYTKYIQNFGGAVFRTNYIFDKGDGTNSTRTFANGAGVSSAIGDDAVGLYMNVTVNSGVDLSAGVTVYPMLVAGASNKVTITEYVPPIGAEGGGSGGGETPSVPTTVTIKTASADNPNTVIESITTTPGETIELTHIFPSMVITSDSDLVILSTEYNRDTNKVIEKLIQAIIALGGNV